MGFFRRNKSALIVAACYAAATIAVAVIAPYATPALFLGAPAVFAAFGISVSPLAAWIIAAAATTAVMSFISGLFAKVCCSPSADQENNVRAEADSTVRAYEQPDNHHGGQQAFLATQMTSAAPVINFVPFHIDPTQTNNGPMQPGFLQTNTGQVVGRGWMTQFGYVPEQQQTPPPPAYTATNVKPEDELTPVFVETYRGGSGYTY